MFNRFLDPKNGVAFKSVFGQEKNKDILIHFLNDVLSHDRIGQIKEVTFLRRAQELKVAPKRQSPIDVRCRDELGRECVAAIDMEVAKRPDYKQRAQYHAAKAYSSISLYEHFNEDFRGVTFLGIANFEILPEDSAIKSEHTFFDRSTYEQDLQNLSFIFIELPKLKKSVKELAGPLDCWCYYLKHAHEISQEDYELLIGKHPILKRAYEVLDQDCWSMVDLKVYESWMRQG